MHSYLDIQLARVSEATFARALELQPHFTDEIRAKLAEIEGGFLTAYDPTPFATALPALRSLKPGTRQRLLDALRSEFASRFQPEGRLAALRERRAAFLSALEAWRVEVRRNGVSPDSAPLWRTLRQVSGELLDLLRDPALKTRWIP